MTMRLDVKRLINDLGGASRVAELVGVVRTAPYRWIKFGYISSHILELIKSKHPDIDLNAYFSEDHDGDS